MSDQTTSDERIPADDGSPLFSEFSAADYAAWRSAAEAMLKGAAFEKKLVSDVYEGFDLQPIYFQEDAAGIAHQYSLPGQFPYVRGTKSSGYLGTGWLIAQELPYGSPKAFNEALCLDIECGQTAVNIPLDAATRAGLDPDQAPTGWVGRGGVSIASVDDLTLALHGVNLEQVPVFVQAGYSGLSFAALFVAYLEHSGQSVHHLRGGVMGDPLGALVKTGELPVSLANAYDETAQVTNWAASHVPQLATIAVSGYDYQDAGGSVVQELAFALATGVDYIRAMLDRELDIDTVARRIQFGFALGGNFFMEVAKLRAARMLWAQIVQAFGGNEAAQKMAIYARSTTWNKTIYDPYVNMLRATTEAFAGGVGGVDSMHIAPFDVAVRPPDSFSRRIARNVQLILQEECNLTRLIDPMGGAWYGEVLTDEVGRRSWTLFQEVERRGGMFQALQDGFPQDQVATTASQRTENLARRKDVLLGTNIYPNLQERQLEGDPIDYVELAADRARQIAEQRRKNLLSLDRLRDTSPEDQLAAAVITARERATLGQIATAIRGVDVEAMTITPLKIERGALLFEELRQNAEAFAARTGYSPQIFLANIGSVSQYKARADFTTGFFEIGGFEILNNDGFATADKAAEAALDSSAPVVVICSSDEVYPNAVPSLVRQIKDRQPGIVVILAGYPKAHVEAFQAAGIDEFIHIRANCYEINHKLQQQLGVGA